MSFIRRVRIAFINDPGRRAYESARFGKSLLDQGKHQKAFLVFKSGFADAVKIESEEAPKPLLLAHLATETGWCLELTGDYIMADVWCMIALKTLPTHAKVHELKARIHVGNEDFAAASASARRALRLNRESAEPDPGIESGLVELGRHVAEQGYELQLD